MAYIRTVFLPRLSATSIFRRFVVCFVVADGRFHFSSSNLFKALFIRLLFSFPLSRRNTLYELTDISIHAQIHNHSHTHCLLLHQTIVYSKCKLQNVTWLYRSIHISFIYSLGFSFSWLVDVLDFALCIFSRILLCFIFGDNGLFLCGWSVCSFSHFLFVVWLFVFARPWFSLT